MPASVTTYYLEMTAPTELRPRRLDRPGLIFSRVATPMPELNRFFYTAIGGDWFWIDRLVWTYQQWLDYLKRPELQTWVLAVDGIPAGYAELEYQEGGNVEIAYFGLLPAFVGHGLGGYALTLTIERAWAMDARRVWVHTCSLDHPSALANYEARGLRVHKQETKAQELPAQAPGPWQGAR